VLEHGDARKRLSAASASAPEGGSSANEFGYAPCGATVNEALAHARDPRPIEGAARGPGGGMFVARRPHGSGVTQTWGWRFERSTTASHSSRRMPRGPQRAGAVVQAARPRPPPAGRTAESVRQIHSPDWQTLEPTYPKAFLRVTGPALGAGLGRK